MAVYSINTYDKFRYYLPTNISIFVDGNQYIFTDKNIGQGATFTVEEMRQNQQPIATKSVLSFYLLYSEMAGIDAFNISDKKGSNLEVVLSPGESVDLPTQYTVVEHSVNSESIIKSKIEMNTYEKAYFEIETIDTDFTRINNLLTDIGY